LIVTTELNSIQRSSFNVASQWLWILRYVRLLGAYDVQVELLGIVHLQKHEVLGEADGLELFLGLSTHGVEVEVVLPQAELVLPGDGLGIVVPLVLGLATDADGQPLLQ
jgi:hypothetical protein